MKDFSKKARSLTWLTEKSNAFVWGKEEEEAWQFLNDKLFRAPILAYFDDEEDCILDADASMAERGS